MDYTVDEINEAEKIIALHKQVVLDFASRETSDFLQTLLLSIFSQSLYAIYNAIDPNCFDEAGKDKMKDCLLKINFSNIAVKEIRKVVKSIEDFNLVLESGLSTKN